MIDVFSILCREGSRFGLHDSWQPLAFLRVGQQPEGVMGRTPEHTVLIPALGLRLGPRVHDSMQYLGLHFFPLENREN